MRRRRLGFLLGALGVASASSLSMCAAAAAPEPDLMNSPTCRAARAQFDQAFDAARSRSSDSQARLDAARQAAARACLGGQAASGRGAGTGLRAPATPVVVPQAGVARPAPAAALPRAAAPPQPPVEIQRPSAITSCDPGGCWATDGSRINRVGPDLVGPRGACSVQGTLATCP